MLGSLARWLRFLGYDTLYPEVEDDTELLLMAKDEGRLLLTRDKELAARAGDGGVLIESVELDGQLAQLRDSLGLELNSDKRMLRCSRCNSVLVQITKEQARQVADERTGAAGAERIPEGVLARHERFWRCTGCGQVYWPGSHYERIIGKIDELEKGSGQ
jgi:uncharacterized protein with PIN domain